MENIDRTRMKLSIMFTVILVSFFLLVWIWFSYFKYESSKREVANNFDSLREFSKQSDDEIMEYINTNKRSIENYPFEMSDEFDADSIVDSIFSDIDFLISDLDSINIVQSIPLDIKNRLIVFKENFIFLSDDSVIFTNLTDYKYLNYSEVLEWYEDGIFYTDEWVIWRIDLSKYTVLIFLKEDYSFKSFKKDVLWYFVVMFVFSVVVYFMVYFMVKRWLKPVWESIDAMNTFIHNAGHELKTPLASIGSSIGLLEKTWEYDKELVLESIWELKRANKLIETLRDLSSLSSTKDKEIFWVWERLKYLVHLLENDINSKGIDLKMEVIDDFEISSNKYYFDILFSNLLTNAIKYNKDNGTINVIVSKPEIIVRDSWMGIPKKEHKKIFDKFYRVKTHRDKDGVGLWLSIVDKIVRINNWKISMKSEEGIGTEFLVRV